MCQPVLHKCVWYCEAPSQNDTSHRVLFINKIWEDLSCLHKRAGNPSSNSSAGLVLQVFLCSPIFVWTHRKHRLLQIFSLAAFSKILMNVCSRPQSGLLYLLLWRCLCGRSPKCSEIPTTPLRCTCHFGELVVTEWLQLMSAPLQLLWIRWRDVMLKHRN